MDKPSMNTEDLLKQHQAERDHIKAQLYNGELRLKELNVIIATLEAVQQSENEE